MKVAIVDYGLGNILSVVSAVSTLRHDPILDRDGSMLNDADVILVPGVAAFGAGIARLEHSGQAERVVARHAAGQGIVGLCLGAQMFLHGSDEAPDVPGLGIADGLAVALDITNCRVPNQGWMRVRPADEPLDTCADGYFYFSHSFRFEPGVGMSQAARAWNGDESFLAVYRQENVIGVQFHPEKSADAGLAFLSDILQASVM